jgi:hypothetical protein
MRIFVFHPFFAFIREYPRASVVAQIGVIGANRC